MSAAELKAFGGWSDADRAFRCFLGLRRGPNCWCQLKSVSVIGISAPASGLTQDH